MWPSILLTGALALLPEELPDAQQFGRLMSGAFAPLLDVEFEFESSLNYVGPVDLLKGKTPESLGTIVQGLLRYRSDGSILIEKFRRSLDQKPPPAILTEAVLRGEKTTLAQIPDQPRRRSRETVQTLSGICTLSGAGSILQIFWPWMFRDPQDMEGRVYENLGWEDHDGHRCMVVRTERYASKAFDPKGENAIEFWIDMERGGNPIRVISRKKGVQTGIGEIRLREFTAEDGVKLWLAVEGRFESFSWNGTLHSKPLLRETFLVLADTVRINQGLGDDAFQVKDVIAPRSEALKDARRAYETYRYPPAPKSDPRSVGEQLEAQAAEVEAKGLALDAGQDTGMIARIVARGLAGAGLLILAAAGVLAWRRRRTG